MINWNLYSKELKRYRNSFIGWGISISVFILMGMAFYPVLMQGDTLKQMSAFFENPFMKNIMTGRQTESWSFLRWSMIARVK